MFLCFLLAMHVFSRGAIIRCTILLRCNMLEEFKYAAHNFDAIWSGVSFTHSIQAFVLLSGDRVVAVRPIDPLVSRYPLPLSAQRAKHEASQARRNHVALPKGHPYRWLPLWVPYGLARFISRSSPESRPS